VTISDVKMQNLISDVSDAILYGKSDLDAVLRRYNVPAQEVDDLISLVFALQDTLVEVQPSRAFQQRLKAELIESRRSSFVWRLRRLPARVQMAALAALAGGFMLLLRRRFVPRERVEEIASIGS